MKTSPKVAFYTLGCKLNFAETSTIERIFNEKGFEKVDFSGCADVVVINTCSVTASADKKCRNIISKAARNSPGAYIAVVGCYSQLKAEEIVNIPGVDLVLGSREKFRIFEYSNNFRKTEPAVYSCDIKVEKGFDPSYSLSGRTRSFLKIQDGCDYFCSYCTIPFARGRSRSSSIGDIVEQAIRISESGVKEVVLTGVNIGDFGAGRAENLIDLLVRLSEETDIGRYRLSSIEPDLLSDEIIRFITGNPRFAPHFHIPLQSGCDRILELMNRKYRRNLFSEKVKAIRAKMGNAGIGADVITGFPGETDREFEETVEFIRNEDISFLHIFSYSDRSNTKASDLHDKVPHNVKESRSRILHSLANEKRRKFLERSAGETHWVLFESFNKKGRMYGFTGNYIKVEASVDEGYINRMVEVRLLEPGEDGIMKGVVI